MYSFNFIILLLVAFVDSLGIGLVYPIFASLLFDPSMEIVSQDASPAWRGALLGILIALTPLVQFIVSPIFGVISDIKGRKKMLALGVSVGCLGYYLAMTGIWMQSIWLLLAYRICVGISEGTVAIAQAALVDISTEETKTRRFSILGAAMGFGFTVGPFLGGKLSDPATGAWASYAVPFILAGCMSVLNLVLITAKFPETRKLAPEVSYNFFEAFCSISKILLWKNLRWIFVGAFILTFGWSFFQEFIPILLRDRFGFSSGGIGDYYACSGFCYAISAGLLTAPLLKKFGTNQIVVKALLGCGLCMLGFVIIPEADYIWILVPALMYMISLVYPTTTAMVSDMADRDSQGEVLGIYQSVQSMAMALSPLFVGSLVGAVPVLAAWGGGVAMMLSAAAFMLARQTAREMASANAV